MYGDAFRRYYNPVSATWTWERMNLAFDRDQVHFGLHLSSGWMSIEAAIATAWRHRAPGSNAQVRLLDPSRVELTTVAWREEETNDEGGDFRGEVWSPLRWKCSQAVCDERYLISSLGRLMSPYTQRATRGFAAHGTRWAACKGSGLVDLLQASGIMEAGVQLPPRVFEAYSSILSGLDPLEHGDRMGISAKLAWDYCNLAAPLVDPSFGKRLSPDVWKLLQSMRGDPVLGGKLKDLHERVSCRLSVTMEELRFVRTCVLNAS
jgi:hypothetical protein